MHCLKILLVPWYSIFIHMSEIVCFETTSIITPENTFISKHVKNSSGKLHSNNALPCIWRAVQILLHILPLVSSTQNPADSKSSIWPWFTFFRFCCCWGITYLPKLRLFLASPENCTMIVPHLVYQSSTTLSLWSSVSLPSSILFNEMLESFETVASKAICEVAGCLIKWFTHLCKSVPTLGSHGFASRPGQVWASWSRPAKKRTSEPGSMPQWPWYFNPLRIEYWSTCWRTNISNDQRFFSPRMLRRRGSNLSSFCTPCTMPQWQSHKGASDEPHCFH